MKPLQIEITDDLRYLRVAQIIKMYPISKPTIWRYVQQGLLTPIKPSPRITVFERKEVEKEESDVCPECGSKIVVRRTRKGRTFYGCAKYPKCKWAGWKLSEAKKID